MWRSYDRPARLPARVGPQVRRALCAGVCGDGGGDVGERAVMRNEKSSKRVAAIAGKILGNVEIYKAGNKCYVEVIDNEGKSYTYFPICTVAELKALAASALTQAADKPKPKKARTHAK